jgi:hypothetical protein
MIDYSQPGMATVRIPQAQTRAGTNILTLLLSDRILDWNTDAAVLLASLEEKRTHYSGWVGLDRIQLRTTNDLTDAVSGDAITASQAIEVLKTANRAPACLTQSARENIEAVISSRLSLADWSSTPTEELISLAKSVDGDLVDTLEAELRTRVEHPLDIAYLEDGVPAIRVLGYLREPAGDTHADCGAVRGARADQA